MKSPIIKRSIEIKGHKTSVSLEDNFWNGLHEIAATNRMPVSELLKTIDAERGEANLSSAIRVYVFSYFRALKNSHSTGGTHSDPARQSLHEQPVINL
jgi:predicted DNA-binding ribbon-helix-helix protein